KITPGQALAAFQASRGDTQTIGLNASGQVIDASPNFGGFSRMTVDFFELGAPTQFSIFNLATVQANQVTFNVTGPAAWLNLSGAKSINIAGTVDFVDTEMLAAVELGSRALNVAPGGVLQASDDGTLAITGSGSNWTNNGAILASVIEVDNNERPLTVTMGAN